MYKIPASLTPHIYFLGKNLVYQTPVISIMVRMNDNGGGNWDSAGKNEKRSGFHITNTLLKIYVK